jgi:hypothetical protein
MVDISIHDKLFMCVVHRVILTYRISRPCPAGITLVPPVPKRATCFIERRALEARLYLSCRLRES